MGQSTSFPGTVGGVRHPARMDAASLLLGLPGGPHSSIVSRPVASAAPAGPADDEPVPPKVQAAVNFLEAGGRRAVIADLDDGPSALAGEAGTEIVPD